MSEKTRVLRIAGSGTGKIDRQAVQASNVKTKAFVPSPPTSTGKSTSDTLIGTVPAPSPESFTDAVKKSQLHRYGK